MPEFQVKFAASLQDSDLFAWTGPGAPEYNLRDVSQGEAESNLRALAAILTAPVIWREHQLVSYSTQLTITGFGDTLLLRFSWIQLFLWF